jgi:hypothetical protein
MHVCPSFSVQVAAQCPPSPGPSGRTAGSALVVRSVPAHTPAAERDPLVHTPAARMAADRRVVACRSDQLVVVDRELVAAGNNCLATAAALQLVRMARALLVDATRTVYVLLVDAHLLVYRKAKRCD